MCIRDSMWPNQPRSDAWVASAIASALSTSRGPERLTSPLPSITKLSTPAARSASTRPIAAAAISRAARPTSKPQSAKMTTCGAAPSTASADAKDGVRSPGGAQSTGSPPASATSSGIQ
eukprot:243103-Prymnesium_polylepis.1